jgi:hypothetical protein
MGEVALTNNLERGMKISFSEEGGKDLENVP